MSFILDALRKSETERQQQTGPGFTDGQIRTKKTSRNIWVPLLVIVLAANLLVLFWIMSLRSDDSATDALVLDSENAGADSGGSPEVRPLAREIVPDRATATTDPVQPRPAAIAPPESQPTTSGGSSEQNTVQTSTAIQEGLPSFQQLVLAGELSVQPMHLDIHVYSGTASERFVFVNMKKYKEGDNLAEGPAIEEITRTGVILNHQGKKFTLDRE